MIRTAIALSLLAAPAFARDLPVSNCEPSPDLAWIACDIQNDGQDAVAAVGYSIAVGEAGRSVPWGNGTSSESIAGGLEPGESLTMRLQLPHLPARARGRDLIYRVVVTATQTATGDFATSSQGRGLPLSAGERDVIRVAIQQCWNVGQLSADALKTNVTVEFEITSTGVPDAASIRMTEYEGGTDAGARQAYEAARRAIVRCGAMGLPIPIDKALARPTMRVAFSPTNMRIEQVTK